MSDLAALAAICATHVMVALVTGLAVVGWGWSRRLAKLEHEVKVLDGAVADLLEAAGIEAKEEPNERPDAP